jgi:hypothetical protein
MRREAERVVAAIKDDELGLEEDVAVDLEIAGRGLYATKASCKRKSSALNHVQKNRDGNSLF